MAGRLDRLGFRRATLGVSALTNAACFPRDSSRGPFWLPCGSHLGPVFSAPALSETRADGGYRDACSIAHSLRGLLDACSIPRQGNPKGARRCGFSRPTPCRQPRDGHPQVDGARPPACQRGNWQVAARGRAASPTKRGRIVSRDKDLSPTCLGKRVQIRRTCLVPPSIERSRTIGRWCSIARRRAHRRRRPLGRRPLGWRLSAS